MRLRLSRPSASALLHETTRLLNTTANSGKGKEWAMSLIGGTGTMAVREVSATRARSLPWTPSRVYFLAPPMIDVSTTGWPLTAHGQGTMPNGFAVRGTPLILI